MKIKVMLLSLAMLAILFAGCGTKEAVKAPVTPNQNTANTPVTPKSDAVASASVTKDPAVFTKAIGKTGTWNIAITENMTIDKDLVLEGDYKNGKKDTAGKDIIQRKVALYDQDDKKAVTARYTLTAPKLTIKSPMASLQHGTFKGDLYVETNDFQLIDNKVIGNIYFISDAAKAGFKMDATSSVSGVQQVKK